MLRVITVAFALLAVAVAHPSRPSAQASQRPLRIIAFGAHPDDAELKASGVAALWATARHKVKFVAMTNGDIGHFESAGGPLALRRKAEVAACSAVTVMNALSGPLNRSMRARQARVSRPMTLAARNVLRSVGSAMRR